MNYCVRCRKLCLKLKKKNIFVHPCKLRQKPVSAIYSGIPKASLLYASAIGVLFLLTRSLQIVFIRVPTPWCLQTCITSSPPTILFCISMDLWKLLKFQITYVKLAKHTCIHCAFRSRILPYSGVIKIRYHDLLWIFENAKETRWQRNPSQLYSAIITQAQYLPTCVPYKNNILLLADPANSVPPNNQWTG